MTMLLYWYPPLNRSKFIFKTIRFAVGLWFPNPLPIVYQDEIEQAYPSRAHLQNIDDTT